MALKVLLAVVAVIILVLVFAALKPDTIRISTSTVINAPPEKVYALLDDFHAWPEWAPQDREDPSMKRTYSGAPAGPGAISEWSGSGNTGNGRMEITGAEPSRKVVVTVDFAKPFVAHNVNTFTLSPEAGGTRVTWAMEGTNAYMMKVMSLAMNMNKMMAQHFESGLANLKAAAEK